MSNPISEYSSLDEYLTMMAGDGAYLVKCTHCIHSIKVAPDDPPGWRTPKYWCCEVPIEEARHDEHDEVEVYYDYCCVVNTDGECSNHATSIISRLIPVQLTFDKLRKLVNKYAFRSDRHAKF